MHEFFTSIVVPTYNRSMRLHATLNSLVLGPHLVERLEVVVVDDGSSDNTSAVCKRDWPFKLTYIQQARRGATVARNTGAQNSRGDILVFLDDDVELMPGAVDMLVEQHECWCRAIVVGTLESADQVGMSPEVREAGISIRSSEGELCRPIPPTECFTGLLSVKATNFFDLGMFQDPTGGWPNWDDVDFGYRAHLAGYHILRAQNARGIHHDIYARHTRSVTQRWYRASKSAVRLFQKYPGIEPYLPMFEDKVPISWYKDSPRLIVRKIARQVASSVILLHGMERITHYLERNQSSSTLFHVLRRWVIGGYIFRGYRDGLHKFDQVIDLERHRTDGAV